MKRNKQKLARKMTPELEKLIGVVGKDLKKKKKLSPAFNSAKKATRYLQKTTF